MSVLMTHIVYSSSQVGAVEVLDPTTDTNDRNPEVRWRSNLMMKSGAVFDPRLHLKLLGAWLIPADDHIPVP